MAFFLTPRFAPAYQSCGPFACAPQRPSYSYRQPSRPRASFPSFVPFLGQVDELLSEINREAQREAHRQRQQRKRAFRARFDVRENSEGYQVDGEVPGFEQEHISIEVTDEHTLKIAGDTEKTVEQQQQQPQAEAAPAAETQLVEAQGQDDKMDGVTLNEPEVARPASPAHSDTGSNKSYQATVEDDFEDLGAETSSTLSAGSSAPSEPKGKEKAVEQPAATETAVQQQPQPEAPAQTQESENREWLSERVHGSFERTFRFQDRIDAANVRASLKNGVLSITVPKAPVPEVRRIVIQ